MKWSLENSGAANLRDITDTVQTVQYSDSQCTCTVYPRQPPRKLLDLFLIKYFKTTKPITFDLSSCYLFKSLIGYNTEGYVAHTGS